LPLSISKTDKGWQVKWNDPRDLLANMRMLDRDYSVQFVGWPGIDVKDEEQDELDDVLQQLEHPCYAVYLDAKTREEFHNEFCKGILWPLFHYVMPTSHFDQSRKYEALWRVYQNVNMLFARKASVATDNEEDAIIWFHSYHLLTAPNFLRKSRPTAQIGFFLHTVFPTSEVFRTLPTRIEVLRGMLASDLIGFHTFDYARHFLSSCKRILDLDFHTLPDDGTLVVHVLGRDVSLRIGHVSIRSHEVHEDCMSDVVKRYAQEFRQRFVGKDDKKIILTVGEYEIVRGLLFTIQGFASFLEEFPKWQDSVVLVVLIRLPNSIQGGLGHYLVKDEIVKEIESINAKYPGKQKVYALYTIADVSLFGTFWDGFNTMPYELTAAQGAVNLPGVVIVSEFMGCMRSLSGVLRVNPWKSSELSQSIQQALVMTAEERRIAHTRRFNHVMHYTFERWAKGYLRDLRKAGEAESQKDIVPIGMGSTAAWVYLEKDFVRLRDMESLLINSFKNAKTRILLFDYGGTLADSEERSRNIAMSHFHSSASVDGGSSTGGSYLKSAPSNILCHLNALAEDPNTYVCVISGHTRSEIDSALPNSPKLCVASEKGAFLRWRGENRWHQHPKLGDYSSWQQIALDVLRTYTERTDGAFIQRKETALVWHYQDSDPDYGDMQAVELERYLRRLLLPFYNITIQKYDHGRILEVLPSEINKGSAAVAIIRKVLDEMEMKTEKADKQDIFLLCVGNDRSDEKMFEAVELSGQEFGTEHIFSVTIGIQPTHAKFYLQDQKEIQWLLSILSGSLRYAKPKGNLGNRMLANQSVPSFNTMQNKESSALGTNKRFAAKKQDSRSQQTPRLGLQTVPSKTELEGTEMPLGMKKTKNSKFLSSGSTGNLQSLIQVAFFCVFRNNDRNWPNNNSMNKSFSFF
ncbi:trehalose-6-phosphate synthase domain-containing protein, partial [Reticulomyxa filosa]